MICYCEGNKKLRGSKCPLKQFQQIGNRGNLLESLQQCNWSWPLMVEIWSIVILAAQIGKQFKKPVEQQQGKSSRLLPKVGSHLLKSGDQCSDSSFKFAVIDR